MIHDIDDSVLLIENECCIQPMLFFPCVYDCMYVAPVNCTAAVHVKCLQTEWADIYDIFVITLVKTCVEMQKDKDWYKLKVPIFA